MKADHLEKREVMRYKYSDYSTPIIIVLIFTIATIIFCIEDESSSRIIKRQAAEREACYPHTVIKNIDVEEQTIRVKPGERVYCSDGFVRSIK